MKKIALAILIALTAFSCTKEKDCPGRGEKDVTLTNFSRIVAGDNFNLIVKQGNAFTVKGRGCTKDLEDLELTERQDGSLLINYSRSSNHRDPLSLEITMPALLRLQLDGVATATVSGFEQQGTAMRLVVGGVAKCAATSLPAFVYAEGSGVGTVTLTGSAPDLIARFSGDAKLNAYGATFADADVTTSGTAKAYVQVQQSLSAIASGNSRIYYKGNPVQMHAEESGTSRVIKE